MGRRLLPALRVLAIPEYVSDVPAKEPVHDPRSPHLVEALARLEVATRQRDAAAAERILGALADTEDGQWLLRQCMAAGLREVAAQIADPSLRSVGPAA